MTQKHNLDSPGAANAVAWAEDVDDTVNRLTGLYLGRLTNVASGNAINGRLPMSAGFTGIATGARFSFVCAGDTTSAVTMQLKDTAGTNVGSSFALRQPNGSAFDATTFLNGGVLYTFEYDAVDGYARQVAIVEQTIAATTLYGWQYLEKQEPTSDVSTITFATDISAYKMIRVEILGQMVTSGAYPQLQYSPDGATWRTIALGPLSTTSNGVVSWMVEVTNVNNADASSVRHALCIHTGNKTAQLDRSSNATNFNPSLDASAGTGGYTTYAESFAFVRLTANTGNFEGSTADQRTIAKLYGYV
jgi:hypothetical protein